MRTTIAVNTRVVEARRLKLGLQKRDLADRSGLHANTVTKALAGEPVSLVSVKALAAALGLSLRSLLAESGDGIASGAGGSRRGATTGAAKLLRAAGAANKTDTGEEASDG